MRSVFFFFLRSGCVVHKIDLIYSEMCSTPLKINFVMANVKLLNKLNISVDTVNCLYYVSTEFRDLAVSDQIGRI